jgi:hypothetical protein
MVSQADWVSPGGLIRAQQITRARHYWRIEATVLTHGWLNWARCAGQTLRETVKPCSVALVGNNGEGKSLTINIILGLSSVLPSAYETNLSAADFRELLIDQGLALSHNVWSRQIGETRSRFPWVSVPIHQLLE